MDKQKNQAAMTNAKLIRLLSDSDLANVIECPVSFNGGKAECDLLYPDDATPKECVECKKSWLREAVREWP